MLRVFWEVMKFIFRNGPNFLFWFGVSVSFFSWFHDFSLWLKIVLFALPIVAIIFSIKRIILEGKEIVSSIPANAATSKKVSVMSSDKVFALKKSIPSNLSMKAIHRYAKNRAKEWASDGVVSSITYYLELKGDTVSQTAQIYIWSETRNELLMTYLPSKAERIEEASENQRGCIPWKLKAGNVSNIFLFKAWREELSTAIEKQSSDVAKAEEIRIQINTNEEPVDFRFYFSKENRRWSKMCAVDIKKYLNVKKKQ